VFAGYLSVTIELFSRICQYVFSVLQKQHKVKDKYCPYYFGYNDTHTVGKTYEATQKNFKGHVFLLCISTGICPVHVKFQLSVDRQTEKRYSKMFTQAARIVSAKNTPRSKTRRLLKKFKRNLSELEKDEVRVKLKRKVSTALQDGGISPRMTDKLTLVFVSLLIEGVELGSAKTGDSIIMYLKCGSVESLLSLKEMVLSDLLLRLLADTIEEFIQSRPQIQLIVKAEDYNSCLSYLNSVSGKFVSVVSLNYKLT